MAQSIGPLLRKQWKNLSVWPGGKWLFSRLLGLIVPYTGTLHASVRTLEPGHCIVVLKDHRRVRNHLHSIHAIALGNLGEMATGLALLNGLPDNTRGILSRISFEYLKKARGELTATCRCEPPGSNEEQEFEVTAEIRDTAGELVAIATANWLTGPEKRTNRAN